MVNLKEHLVQFMVLATGGPPHYDRKEMKSAYAGMKIGNSEFDTALGDLKAPLDTLQIPKSSVLWRIETPTDSGQIMKNSHRDDNLRNAVKRARPELLHPTGAQFAEVSSLAGGHYLRPGPEKPEAVKRL